MLGIFFWILVDVIDFKIDFKFIGFLWLIWGIEWIIWLLLVFVGVFIRVFFFFKIFEILVIFGLIIRGLFGVIVGVIFFELVIFLVWLFFNRDKDDFR